MLHPPSAGFRLRLRRPLATLLASTALALVGCQSGGPDRHVALDELPSPGRSWSGPYIGDYACEYQACRSSYVLPDLARPDAEAQLRAGGWTTDRVSDEGSWWSKETGSLLGDVSNEIGLVDCDATSPDLAPLVRAAGAEPRGSALCLHAHQYR